VIRLEVAGVSWGVLHLETPAGAVKVVVLQDQQSGIEIRAPFDEEPAKELAAALTSKNIVIANDLPPHA
jgi:hypothetical protein